MEKKAPEQKYNLRLNDVLELLGGISRPTLWRIRKYQNFPPGKAITSKTRIWNKEEVLKWLESRG